jgi:Omp85 superfamily domain
MLEAWGEGSILAAPAQPGPRSAVEGFMRRLSPLRRWLLRLALLGLGVLSAAPAWGLERRRPQFPNEPAYLIVPFPYDLPGIGKGIAWTGLAANMLGTHTDIYGIAVTGEASGQIVGLQDMELIPERLILNLNVQRINKAEVRQYPTRGMNAPGNLYTLTEVNQADENFGELRLTLDDRRYEFFLSLDSFTSAAVRVRAPDGSLIAAFAEPFRQTQRQFLLGALVDQTDDYSDPRRGVRFQATVSHSPPQSVEDADFRVWNYSLSGYVPVGSISTLLLNYFQSDAEVLRKGNTDPATIAAELGLNCGADPVCLGVQAALVQTIAEQRANGSSASLGGQDMLRSFTRDRFQGAHTRFYGAEFRWNLTEEVTPFDYFIWKDVRTNVQLAFFAETGSVGETRDEVGRTWRSSYGMGLRMVSGSGFVYRADVATGPEGGEVTVIFGYPF